jgi:hypothetical protein
MQSALGWGHLIRSNRTSMEHTEDFALRRTIQPYAALLIVLVAITLLGVFDAIKTHDLNWIGAILFLWAISILTQYPDTRYRIFWENDAIKQIAVYGTPTVIEPSEINKITQERSDLQTLLAMRRPSRRIAIYARGPSGHKWIDVSLKHFAAEDIRRLMRAIHEQRPDLSMPKNWI